MQQENLSILTMKRENSHAITKKSDWSLGNLTTLSQLQTLRCDMINECQVDKDLKGGVSHVYYPTICPETEEDDV